VKAFLLAASVGADLYGEGDTSLLERLASLIGPQVSWLVASAGSAERESRAPSVDAAGMAAQAASMLATSTDLPDAMRRIREIAAGFLPFDELRHAIRLRQGDRVVLLEPGERRALSDLPLMPVAGTTLGQVLAAELPYSFELMEGEARLVVPLRVGGRVQGALLLSARQPATLGEAHRAPAQQLADVVAPHLELLRRSALLPPPYRPGWKRTQRS
jgi:GAF domain-containing protein